MANDTSLDTITLNSVLESPAISVILRKINGEITCWNRGAEELYGYSQSEALGNGFSFLNHKRNKDNERLLYMEVLSSKQPLKDHITNHLRKDGSEVDVSMTLSPINDNDGQVVGYSEVTKECIPDAVHSEQFRIALDNSPVGKVMINSSGKIIYVNKATEKIFQYQKEELVGNAIEVLVPQRIRKQHLDDRTRYSNDPTTRPMGADRELHGVRKDGKEIPVEIGLTSFSTPQGNIVMAAILDISERKKLEGAVRSNRELEQFAYIASHDLQAPLRHIASYIEFLAEENESVHDEQSKEWIRTIQRGVDRMRSLINDLLKYSRVAHGKPKYSDASLNEIIEGVIETLSNSIEESNVSITYDQLPVVRCIPNLMSEVFQNLIDNSIKFSKEGCSQSIHISVSSDKDFWEITLKDTGIGIDNRYLGRIFTPFQRLHKQSEKPGTGIGLAIVKKVAEMHNGKVWVESVKGKGSTFHFTIAKKELITSEVS